MSKLPSLPEFKGQNVLDISLDVFSHPSIRFPGAPKNEEYGDAERLENIGRRVFDMAVAAHFFDHKPLLTSEEMQTKFKEATSDTKVKQWQATYGIKSKIRCAQSEIGKLDEPSEIKRFFYTFTGALYVRNGHDEVRSWVSQLVDPDSEPTVKTESTPEPSQTSSSYSSTSQTRTKSSANTWPTQATQTNQSAPPPPPVYTSSPPNSTVTLATLNQKAAQMGRNVTYPAEQSGPPHNPTWTVRCCIDGHERGQGQGRSQKIAKEAAAREAWTAMQW